MRFIHIADVHYGVKPDKGRNWSEDREIEVKETFKHVLDVVEKSQVDLLLIAGDLFHSLPTEEDLREIDYLLGKLTYARTIIIAGNHDYIAEGSPYERYKFTSKTVCLPASKISSVYLKDINTCITGYSFGSKEITEDVFAEVVPVKEGATNILLAHGGDPTHIPFNKEYLKSAGFDYVALGHIHKPEIIKENLMAYSCSLEPIDGTEIGKRGYIYGEITDKTLISFKQCNVRSYLNLGLEVNPECTNEMILDTLTSGINRLGVDNIYRILLRGRKSNDVEIDLRSLEKRYNIYEIVENVYRDYDIKQLYEDNRENIIGKYIETFIDNQDDEISKKALHYGVEAILASGNR